MKMEVTFSNGYKMPVIGLGTWHATKEEELEATLGAALEVGYRHLDTANLYQNEKVIGTVLKKFFDSGKIGREELFIVTKLPPTGMSPEKVSHFVQKSLQNLQLTYIDLYLVHGPIGLQFTEDDIRFPSKDGKILFDFKTDLVAIWKALEKEVDSGRIRSLGVSNFSEEQLERVFHAAEHKPMNHQMELNPYIQQKSLREVCEKLGVTVCCYAPFGSPGRKASYEEKGLKFESNGLLDDPVVARIAKRHGKTPSQVLLRFCIQLGTAAIPKSSKPTRIAENFKVFDFELSQAEMKELESLDKGEAGRTFTFEHLPGVQKHPEFPFKKI